MFFLFLNNLLEVNPNKIIKPPIPKKTKYENIEECGSISPVFAFVM